MKLSEILLKNAPKPKNIFKVEIQEAEIVEPIIPRVKRETTIEQDIAEIKQKLAEVENKMVAESKIMEQINEPGK